METNIKGERRLFTLIELLVVTAIIGVLAALFMPALQAAKDKAQGLSCQSNLRQIAMVMTIYPMDNDDYAMPARMDGDIGNWINYAADALDTDDSTVFRCPTLSENDCFNPYGGSGRYNRVQKGSYIMNAIHAGNWSTADLSEENSAKLSGWSDGTTGAVKMRSLIRPAEKIAVVDGRKKFPDEWALAWNSDATGIIRFTETDHGPPDGERDVGDHHG
ncbi:MAG: type II secretion system protein, partial [Verrucomicrobiota bacterium]